MKRITLIVALCLGMSTLAQGANDKPFLLQSPTVSQAEIVFVTAGDLWVVSRAGGEARRLTSGVGIETDPYFSPTGEWIAFTGEYDGNVDVFVVAAKGGVPRRVTWHPGADRVAGWTIDGKILFRSARNSTSGSFNRLFTVPIDGGFPTEVPLPLAEEASFSPNGSRLAYMPLARAFRTWKRYRGGRTTAIWIAEMADSRIEKIPRENSNDFAPMWVGDQVYFLSDRNGPVTLFSYDTASRKVARVLPNDGLDIKSASAGPGAIVYEQFGTVHLYDLKARKSQRIDIRVTGDMPEVRARFDRVARNISAAKISPTGARALFEARGEIFTLPAEKGDARNLTRTAGIAERDPSWSPDGKRIAYFSEESGEYALHLRGQDGLGEPEKIKLSSPGTYYYTPLWSPDSKKIAYTDKKLKVWYVDVDKKTPVLVDTDIYDGPRRVSELSWSPDSRWVAYTKQLENYLRVIYVYSLETGSKHQLTDGMSDVAFPVFDKDGKHLYFTASTDFGLTVGWRDMSSIARPVTRSVYVAVLRNDLPSPLEFESDEEKASIPPEAPREKPAEKPAGPMRIDVENIGQRILALPVPARNYSGLRAGKAGVLFILERTYDVRADAGHHAAKHG